MITQQDSRREKYGFNDKTSGVNVFELETIYLIKGKWWFKILANILLIQIYSVLNYLWINSILLIWKLFIFLRKWKLFMTQINNLYCIHLQQILQVGRQCFSQSSSSLRLDYRSL